MRTAYAERPGMIINEKILITGATGSVAAPLACYRGGMDDFEGLLRVDGEGTGHGLRHCRIAKAALAMSSGAIYAPVPGSTHTAGSDQTRRRAINGPSKMKFAQAFRKIYNERYGNKN